MPEYDSLKAFYDERAELAHTIEHVPLGKTSFTMARYNVLQTDLASLQTTFAQTWILPSVYTVLLPWCSICGNQDRDLLPGKTLCAICETMIHAGDIPRGEHAETKYRKNIPDNPMS